MGNCNNCNNCCNNSDRKDEIITDKVKVTIIKDFNTIVTTLNPFYFYNYSIIEDIEKRFLENDLSFNEFIDVWKGGFLNNQIKYAYLYCLDNLKKLFDDEKMISLIFLDIMMLILSPSSSSYRKKEEIVNFIMNRKQTEDNYAKIISTVTELVTICLKISFSFIFLFFVFSKNEIDQVKELFEYNKSIYPNGEETFTNKVQNKKLLIFNELVPLFIERDKDSFNIFNFKNSFIENMEILKDNFFRFIVKKYKITTHSNYTKYFDYITAYSMRKLFFNKSNFTDVKDNELKSIIHDIIEILDIWKLFELIFK